MKLKLVWLAVLLAGYLAGNLLPLSRLVANPAQRARFSKDYVIKAGTSAKVGGGFSDSVTYPVELTFDHRDSVRPILIPIP